MGVDTRTKSSGGPPAVVACQADWARVEVILRLPEATLQGYRGKSGGRLDSPGVPGKVRWKA
ncbi:hypothetical protein DXA96_19215 [Lachnospiraceae bacterium OF09-33XD]|nr:hypothetical protein DXA96_19215 [Lachnospiraceae bacterium OF09-33XD]